MKTQARANNSALVAIFAMADLGIARLRNGKPPGGYRQRAGTVVKGDARAVATLTRDRDVRAASACGKSARVSNSRLAEES
jgi:hypothetical protein